MLLETAITQAATKVFPEITPEEKEWEKEEEADIEQEEQVNDTEARVPSQLATAAEQSSVKESYQGKRCRSYR